MKPILSAITIFLLSAHFLRAANFYVDYSTGSDSNSGTSTEAPWKHCPGDPAASGNSRSKALSAGDNVFFKGGVTYILTGSTGIILAWNGTASNRITYDGNSSGAWGSGKAKITDNNRSPGLFAMRAISGDLRYVSIKGFLFKDLGGAATLPADTGSPVAPNSGAGVYANGRMTGVVIDNCDFTQIGYWFNQKPMSAGSIVGAGVEFDAGCTDTTISNCTFSRTMIGIEGIWRSPNGGIDGLTIFGCTFSDSLVWCIDLPPATNGATMKNVAIHSNVFTDYYQFDDPQWKGYGEWPHTDGIFLRSDYDGCTWGTINIWNNKFSSSRTTAGGTAAIYITEGPSANVYNNLFIHPGKSRSISLANGVHTGASPQVVRILNNTFLCDYTTQIDWGEGNGGTPVGSGSGSSITIKNNLFVDLQSASANNFMVYSVSKASVATFAFDYNNYYTGNVSGKFFKTNLTGDSNLLSIRAAGWESNGGYFDPLFIKSVSAGSDPNSANLRLQSSSPSRSAGTNLSSLTSTLTGLDRDPDGNIRPVSGAWDVGAFSFGASLLRPPTNALINIITNP